MITYLNKEAVRNALSDIGMKAGGLWEIIRMVDNGEFDAKFPENESRQIAGFGEAEDQNICSNYD